MKKTNIIIFLVIILVIVAIFAYAMWDANKSLNELGSANTQIEQEENNKTNVVSANTVNGNEVATNETQINPTTGDANEGTTINYVGKWYISEEAYRNSETIDELMDRREDNEITNTEFENQMQSEINTNIVELDVERYFQNTIKFDFTVISPAPTQREGHLDDIEVTLEENTGTFTYTDNWGTSGNGTITLNDDNSITLRLETTSAAQGALWGVEGIYTFSYKRVD